MPAGGNGLVVMVVGYWTDGFLTETMKEEDETHGYTRVRVG